MVSTDNEEIKKIALQYGAAVPFLRSSENSDDSASTSDVILEVLSQYEICGQKFDTACCIYPTAPFITGNKLLNAMDILAAGKYDSVVPVVQYSFPPQRCFIVKNEIAKYLYPENEFVRSQDLEPLYHDAGQFYCINVVSFLDQKKLIMNNTYAFIMDDMEVQDIDNMSDWELAELKYHHMIKE